MLKYSGIKFLIHIRGDTHVLLKGRNLRTNTWIQWRWADAGLGNEVDVC